MSALGELALIVSVTLVLSTMVHQPVESIQWLGLYRYHQQRHWNHTSDCRFPSRRSSTPTATNQVLASNSILRSKYAPSSSNSSPSPPTERKQVRDRGGEGQGQPLFAGTQRRLCKRNVELMSSVVSAARVTVELCQTLFYDSRWNCSSIVSAPRFTPDLATGTREQAFVVALSAASLSQSVAKACSAGVSRKCGCAPDIANTATSQPQPPDFQWGGCGDDVKFGLAFGEAFSGARANRKKTTIKSLSDLHNQRVGRKLMADSLSTTCKCHGVSGSCALKTCWKALPDMRFIGTLIHRAYHEAAVEVMSLPVAETTSGQQRHVTMTGRWTGKNVSEDQLSFYSLSPDYCLPDPSLGSVGTQGRECQKDQPGSLGCRSMCCGRRFTTETIEVKYRCECKYIWCCYVKCKICTKMVDVHRCT